MFKVDNVKVIGLCGVAQSGKDTFCKHAIKLFKEQDVQCERISFADALKADVDPFLKDKVGISAFTNNSQEKSLIRDFLVAYGTKLIRKIDDRCWIDKVSNKVQDNIANDIITIITDIRYPNEIEWVQKDLEGKCLHISRIQDGEYIPPANSEESNYNPLLKSKADSSLNWATMDDEEVLEWIVGDELNNLLNLTAVTA